MPISDVERSLIGRATLYLVAALPRSGSSWFVTRLAQLPCHATRGEDGFTDWIASRQARFELGCGTRHWGNATATADCLDEYFARATRARGRTGDTWAARMGVAPASLDGCATLALGGKVWAPHLVNATTRRLDGAVAAYLRARRARVVLLLRANVLEELVSMKRCERRAARAARRARAVGDEAEPPPLSFSFSGTSSAARAAAARPTSSSACTAPSARAATPRARAGR